MKHKVDGYLFRTSKPPGQRTRHPGQESMSHPSVGRQKWVLAVVKATAGEVLRNSRPCDQDCWHTGLYFVKGAGC